MGKKQNALLITFHNWESQRLAGFHFIAKSFLNNGYDVGFCSYKRPLISAVFNRSNIHNIKSWFRLFKGKKYKEAGNSLFNFCGLDLTLPNRLSKILFKWEFNKYIQNFSDYLIVKKCLKLYPNPKFIVIESGTAIYSYKFVRKFYPQATIIYRPSDPCVGGKNGDQFLDLEKLIFAGADKVLLVNKESENLYKKYSFDISRPNLEILPNAIDVESFKKNYKIPDILKKAPTITYLGGHPPNLELIFKTADKIKSANFLIICPERINKPELNKISKISNLDYIEGVLPTEVPKYIKNSTIIMIPYKEEYKNKPLGMHGKIIQAIACKKPIVCKNIDESLKKFGVLIAQTDEDFISILRDLINKKVVYVEYEYKLRDWADFCEDFSNHLKL